MPNICVALKRPNVISETFIAAHIERLNSVNCVVHQLAAQPAISNSLVLPQGLIPRACRKISRVVRRVPWDDEVERGYRQAFRQASTDVVLAEYGTIGVLVMRACKSANVPLVVHFHGYDASRREVIEAMRAKYLEMFQVASACVVVSKLMRSTLLELGCPKEKLVYFPYGVAADDSFSHHGRSGVYKLIGVGRFVEKKAPYLTLLAFARVSQQFPQARLTLIGEGPLLPVCQQMAAALGLKDAVRFLGAQPHSTVKAEMRDADVFVQHSIVASDGDSEGTPVAVLEAGAMGLPVVATRHAGIPDVVVHGETGLLSEECDIDAMAENICHLLTNPADCRQMGYNAFEHVRRYYTLDKNIQRLQSVLEAAAFRRGLDQTRYEIERSLPASQSESISVSE